MEIEANEPLTSLRAFTYSAAWQEDFHKTVMRRMKREKMRNWKLEKEKCSKTETVNSQRN